MLQPRQGKLLLRQIASPSSLSIPNSMPNIATVLKSEISRISRKELRLQTDALVKAGRSSRSDIGSLKRRVRELEVLVRRLGQKAPKQAAVVEEEGSGLRFSAKGLLSNRRRLGLSADDFGKLVGASGNTIYNWENGATQPRASFHAAIASVRQIGKRKAQMLLQSMA